MAVFSFFRRRQKMVLVVMVVLMVAFLIPSLFQGRNRGQDRDAVIGYIDDEKVTIHMQQAAENDLNLLRRSLGMGMGRRAGEGTFVAFLQINRNQNAGLTWLLLLREASQRGIAIRENEVESFLVESGLTSETYRRELADLRDAGYTEKHLRQAVANYLTVMTAFQTAEMNTMPSLPELRHNFGDLWERIALAMVALPAKDFTADVPEPSEEAVAGQFDQYKHLFSQDPTNTTDFGFGYRMPDRLDIAWLFIDEGPVAAAVEPLEKKMMDYWEEHKSELKNRIPIEVSKRDLSRLESLPTTSTAPAGTATTEPAEEKFREVPFESFSQAKAQIRPLFMPEAVDAGMSSIVSLARGTIQRLSDLPTGQAGADEPYSAAARAMIHPADALLNRKVASLPFAKAPLETIIEELEELAGVKIVYPFGKHEKFTLDEKVVVSIKPWGDITLGEALDRIGNQAKCPPVKWVTCDGMDGAIFASEPVNLVPVSAGRTGMAGFEEIYRHELLGQAGLKSEAGPGGQSLLSIAATAEVFKPAGQKHVPLIKPGGDFEHTMYVSGPRKGRLLWRLVNAEATNAPLHLDQEIRKQVIEDLKTVEGFKKALAVAEAMKVELNKKPDGDLPTGQAGLKKLADAKKLAFSETEPFSRKTLDIRSGQISFSNIPDIGQDKQFIESAFTLVPPDPNEPVADRPAMVIPLRRQGKVMLVQRIGYEPATEANFAGLVAGPIIVEVPRQDENGKISMGYGIKNVTMNEVLMRRRWEQTVIGWFSGQNVIKRVNYRSERPSD